MSNIGVVYMSGFPISSYFDFNFMYLAIDTLESIINDSDQELGANRVLGLNMRLSHHSIFTVLLVDDHVDFCPQDRGQSDDSELNA